jgi:hypothetical protein
MSDAKAMVKESGTYMVLGILFVIVSVALGAAILYLEDVVATPLGKIGMFLIVIVNFILIGYVVVSLAGVKKDVSKVIGKVTWVILELPRRFVLIILEVSLPPPTL